MLRAIHLAAPETLKLDAQAAIRRFVGCGGPTEEERKTRLAQTKPEQELVIINSCALARVARWSNEALTIPRYRATKENEQLLRYLGP